MASSDTWLERMAANANNNMDVSVKRCPCFRRGSFTCANALCQSRSRGSSCSIPLSFRHFWMASVYFICLFFLDGSMFLFHLILAKMRRFVTLLFFSTYKPYTSNKKEMFKEIYNVKYYADHHNYIYDFQ